LGGLEDTESSSICVEEIALDLKTKLLPSLRIHFNLAERKHGDDLQYAYRYG